MEIKRIADENELQKALQIRKEVFVKEQRVPIENEIDEFDKLESDCEHVILYYNEQPAGTGRVRIVDGKGKMERICILKEFRKYGLGKIITLALEDIAKEKGATEAKLHGQTQAEAFYKKLGYKTASEVFLEENIPHVLMIKKL